MTTPLQEARDHLNNRATAADDAGDWAQRMLLSNLYDVADYMCRIGDHDGRHYHADKSGPLVHAAMRVRKVALERYGGMFDRDVDDDPAYEAIDKATGLLLEVDGVVAHVMWKAARSADGAEPLPVRCARSPSHGRRSAALGRRGGCLGHTGSGRRVNAKMPPA